MAEDRGANRGIGRGGGGNFLWKKIQGGTAGRCKSEVPSGTSDNRVEKTRVLLRIAQLGLKKQGGGEPGNEEILGGGASEG